MSPADLVCQKSLDFRIHGHAINGPCKAMPFIVGQQVTDPVASITQSNGDLVSFGLLDAGIIGSLNDQQWA